MIEKLHLGSLGAHNLWAREINCVPNQSETDLITIIIASGNERTSWSELIRDGVTHSAVIDLVHEQIDRIRAWFAPHIHEDQLGWRFETLAHRRSASLGPHILLTIGPADALKNGAFFKKAAHSVRY